MTCTSQFTPWSTGRLVPRNFLIGRYSTGRTERCCRSQYLRPAFALRDLFNKKSILSKPHIWRIAKYYSSSWCGDLFLASNFLSILNFSAPFTLTPRYCFLLSLNCKDNQEAQMGGRMNPSRHSEQVIRILLLDLLVANLYQAVFISLHFWNW